MEPNLPPSLESSFEFSKEQNVVIKSLSTCMRWVGAVLLVVGALLCIAGVLRLADGGLASLLTGIIYVVIAVFTYQAANAFRRVVDSTGQDVNHLMAALGSLRNLYRLQVIILAVAALFLIVSLGLLFISSLLK